MQNRINTRQWDLARVYQPPGAALPQVTVAAWRGHDQALASIRAFNVLALYSMHAHRTGRHETALPCRSDT